MYIFLYLAPNPWDLGPKCSRGLSGGPGFGPQGHQGPQLGPWIWTQLGPCPHNKKKSSVTYIDFHDGNNKCIKIDDTRVLWEWEEEESIKMKKRIKVDDGRKRRRRRRSKRRREGRRGWCNQLKLWGLGSTLRGICRGLKKYLLRICCFFCFFNYFLGKKKRQNQRFF